MSHKTLTSTHCFGISFETNNHQNHIGQRCPLARWHKTANLVSRRELFVGRQGSAWCLIKSLRAMVSSGPWSDAREAKTMHWMLHSMSHRLSLLSHTPWCNHSVSSMHLLSCTDDTVAVTNMFVGRMPAICLVPNVYYEFHETCH